MAIDDVLCCIYFTFTHHTHMHTFILTLTHTHACTHKHTSTHLHTHCTHTHCTHTHTHTHTHIYTHTHTHTHQLWWAESYTYPICRGNGRSNILDVYHCPWYPQVNIPNRYTYESSFLDHFCPHSTSYFVFRA